MKSMLIDPTKIRGSNIYGGRIKAPNLKDAKTIMKGSQSSINSKFCDEIIGARDNADVKNTADRSGGHGL